MDFSLSDDEAAIKDLAEKIFRNRITDDFWKDYDGRAGYDETLWALLAEAGVLGAPLPSASGGSDLGFVELCLILEAQGRFLAPVPLLSTLVLGALPIAKFGDAKQQQAWLPAVAAGRAVLATAAAQTTAAETTGAENAAPFRATKDGAGWRLNGELGGVWHGAQADAILVPASTQDGLALFIIEKDTPGLQVTPQITTNHEPVARVVLNDLEANETMLLGSPDKGGENWTWIEQRWLIAIAALQLGVAQDVLRRTSQYGAERQQFGRPIGGFQAVAHRIADAYIDIEAMRVTLWQAVWRLANDMPADTQVRAAKWWACEGGHRVAHAGQHLHGGTGADIEYPLHRYFLWAKQLEFSAGAASSQLSQIGRSLAAE